MAKRRPFSSIANSCRAAKMISLVELLFFQFFLTRHSPRPCPLQASTHVFQKGPDWNFVGVRMESNSWAARDVIISINLKSKTKEPPKLLSSSDMRRVKFISVNDFSAQEHDSSKNRHILNFIHVMAVREKSMNVIVEKYILISRFLTFLEVKVLEKVLI